MLNTKYISWVAILWIGLFPSLWAEENSPLDITREEGSLFVNFKMEGISSLSAETLQGRFTKIKFENSVSLSEKGSPELPSLTKLLDIPGKDAEIRIIAYKSRKIKPDSVNEASKIIPKQAPRSKSLTQGIDEFIYNRELYSRDSLLGGDIIEIKKSGKYRGEELNLLVINPVKYNPYRNEIELIYELKAEIRYKPAEIRKGAISTRSGYEPAAYVILSDTIFKKVLRPFVEWKTKKGFNVTEIYRGENGAGNTENELREHLKQLFHSGPDGTAGFSYLLIVGDDQQIPAFTGKADYHSTDLYYAEYDGEEPGDDFIPDVLIGRFSAQDTSQLIPQIEKTLEYEQYLFPDTSFLKRAILIAGYDASGNDLTQGNGQINYGHEYYFNAEHGFETQKYLSRASMSQDSLIRAEIGKGASIVNYTGHGEWNRWRDPTLHIDHIPDLNNAHKYPLMIGNGCVTSVFSYYDECFAEAVLRAKDEGALAYIGCTNDSYWDEDYWWAVGTGIPEANPTYNETGKGMYDMAFHEGLEAMENWAGSTAEYIFAGNLAVMQGNPSYSQYYWEIYHLMGDPSLMPYLSVPDSIEVLIPDSLPPGTNKLQLETGEYIYAGLTNKGELIAGGHSNKDGLILLDFPELQQGDSLLLVLSGQNRRPVIKHIGIKAQSGPYIVIDTIIPDDSENNSNQIPENGESIKLDIVLKNRGLTEGTGIITDISTSDSRVNIIDGTEVWGSLGAGADMERKGVFAMVLPDSIADGEEISFEIDIKEEGSAPIREYYIINISAPTAIHGKYFVNDSIWGNGNGRPDPGEKIELGIVIENRGSSDTRGLSVLIQSENSICIINTDSVYTDNIAPGNSYIARFNMDISEEANTDSLFSINVETKALPYFVEDEIILTVGHAELDYEDFESGDMSRYPWVNDSKYPWEICNKEAYQGIYSTVSAEIGSNQSSTHSLPVYVAEDDSICFAYKISSELNYDFLSFHINNIRMGRWSGESDWNTVCFPLDSGKHDLKWVYNKDGNTSHGMDRAWIDFIVFPDSTKPSFTYEMAAGNYSIYPNPFGDIINIKPNNTEGSKSLNISLYDITGRKLIERTEHIQGRGNIISLNTGSLRKGIYLLRLGSGYKTKTYKLLH